MLANAEDTRPPPTHCAAAAAPATPVAAAPPPTRYEHSERVFRYGLALIFSAMLIVLVAVGGMLLFGR